MSRNTWVTLGTAIGVIGVGGALLYSRRASAASPPPNTGQEPLPPLELAPLPKASEIKGDLVTNWGTTPADLRPLFMRMEEASKIIGSARVFAVIAYRESRFVTAAHNGNAPTEDAERDSSRAAYEGGKGRNPPLRYGEEAANFGSGGLFGLLAPYFLWSGVPEVGSKAPLLGAPPELVFQPRAAAFAATVYMQRILKHYRVDDVPDVKVGWANPSLLGSGRGGSKYQEVRGRFLADATTQGIDLADRMTIPEKLDAAAWPGVPAVFAGLVGALPRELA
jgi:hypothetical protein